MTFNNMTTLHRCS